MRRAKTDNDSAGLFFKLGRGKAGFFHQFPHLERSPSPKLNQASTKENFGNQWIPAQ